MTCKTANLKEIENAIGDAMTDPDIPTMAIYSNIDVAKKYEEELFKDTNADDNGFYTFIKEPELHYGKYITYVSALFCYDDYYFDSFIEPSEYEDIRREEFNVKINQKNYSLNIAVENISSKEPYGKWVLRLILGTQSFEKEIEITKKYNQVKNEYYYDAQIKESTISNDFSSKENEKINERIKLIYECYGYQTYVAFKTNKLFPLN